LFLLVPNYRGKPAVDKHFHGSTQQIQLFSPREAHGILTPKAHRRLIEIVTWVAQDWGNGDTSACIHIWVF